MTQNPNPPVDEKSFPAGAILVDTYTSMWKGLPYALRLSWAWILVGVCLLVAADLIVGGALTSKANRDGVADWSSFAVVLLFSLPLASIAVAWHRWLLLREVDRTRIYLRLDRMVFVYLGFAIVVQLIAWSPYIAPWVLRQFFKLVATVAFGFSLDRHSAVDYVLSDQGLLASPIIQIFAFIGLFLFTTRLGLVLPAKAIGAPGVTLKRAWLATRGHTYGLVVGLFLAVIPIALLFAGLRLAGLDFSAQDGSWLHVIDRLTFVIFETWIGLVQVAFLSYSFRYFFPLGGTPTAAKARS